MALFADTSFRTGTCLSCMFECVCPHGPQWIESLGCDWLLTLIFIFLLASSDQCQCSMWAHIWPKMCVGDGNDWQAVCPCKRDWLLVDVDVPAAGANWIGFSAAPSHRWRCPFFLPLTLPSPSTYLQLLLLIDSMTQWQSGGAVSSWSPGRVSHLADVWLAVTHLIESYTVEVWMLASPSTALTCGQVCVRLLSALSAHT